MRRRSRSLCEGPLSLVPMADMLTNTVGIMLFIMAFTILASAGAVVLRTLPKETASEQSPIFFVCADGRVLPLDDTIGQQLIEGLPKPTFSTLGSWVERFNAARHEDDYFIVTGRGRAVYGMFDSSAQLKLTANYTAKTGAGDDSKMLASASSSFSRTIEKYANTKTFAYFIVYPDSIDIFRKARQVAADRYHIRSGWTPQASGNPVMIVLSRGEGGVNPTPQTR